MRATRIVPPTLMAVMAIAPAATAQARRDFQLELEVAA